MALFLDEEDETGEADDEALTYEEPEEEEITDEDLAELEALEREFDEEEKKAAGEKTTQLLGNESGAGPVPGSLTESNESRQEELAEGFEIVASEPVAEPEKESAAAPPAPKKDMERAAESMESVSGLNFVPQSPKARGPSRWKRFWSGVSTVAGKIVKGMTNALLMPYALATHVRGSRALKKALPKMQQSRDYSTIPGWGGAKFEPKKDESGNVVEETGEDILGDQRRVPTVWAYPLASGATRNGKRIPPEVTVMVSEPEHGTDKHLVGFGRAGHTFMGIAYNRYSNVTQRTERYAIQFGFFPTGGFNNISDDAVMLQRDAMVPGQLMNEKGHSYGISRRYPATMEQVGKIVKAAEKYASGGYGMFRRNCTTFVKTMVVDEAGLTSPGDDVFQETTVELNGSLNAARAFMSAAQTFNTASFKEKLSGLTDKTDLSYQHYGEKRITAEDIAHNAQAMDEAGFTKKGYVPGAVAGGLQRETGEGAGILGSHMKTPKNANIAKLFGYMSAMNLKNAIASLLQLDEDAEWPGPLQELESLFTEMEIYYQFLRDRDRKNIGNDLDLEEGRIRSLGRYLDRMQTAISTVYSGTLKGDTRIYQDVTDYLSILTFSREYLDSLYEKAIIGAHKNQDSDIENAATMIYGPKAMVTLKGTQPGQSPVDSVRGMSASWYEATIQVLGTPDDEKRRKDWEAYFAYRKLKYEGREADTPLMKKMERIDALISQFDSSHQYMLEKESFSQQDMEYIFKLEKQEKAGGMVESKLLNIGVGASSAYETVALGTIFNGMREDILGDGAGEGLPANVRAIAGRYGKSSASVQRWLNNYLEEKIRGKEETIRTIFKAWMEVNGKDETKAGEAFRDMLVVYMVRALRSNGKKITDNLRKSFIDTLRWIFVNRLSFCNTLRQLMEPAAQEPEGTGADVMAAG